MNIVRILEYLNGLGPLLAGPERYIPAAPPPQRRLTPEQIGQLAVDYKAGVGSIYTLAKIYSMNRGTVADHLHAAGLKLGRLPLTEAEIERASKLRTEGHSYNSIGRILRRDPKTVKRALA